MDVSFFFWCLNKFSTLISLSRLRIDSRKDEFRDFVFFSSKHLRINKVPSLPRSCFVLDWDSRPSWRSSHIFGSEKDFDPPIHTRNAPSHREQSVVMKKGRKLEVAGLRSVSDSLIIFECIAYMIGWGQFARREWINCKTGHKWKHLNLIIKHDLRQGSSPLKMFLNVDSNPMNLIHKNELGRRNRRKYRFSGSSEHFFFGWFKKQTKKKIYLLEKTETHQHTSVCMFQLYALWAHFFISDIFIYYL